MKYKIYCVCVVALSSMAMAHTHVVVSPSDPLVSTATIQRRSLGDPKPLTSTQRAKQLEKAFNLTVCSEIADGTINNTGDVVGLEKKVSVPVLPSYIHFRSVY